ncbi:MAG: 2Fe-2S iron-sulfur cluster-binding protein [Lautropia sp.]
MLGPHPEHRPFTVPVHHVTLCDLARTFPVAADQTILEAALAADIDYPFGCESGMCGACRSQCVAGSVRMASFRRSALSETDEALGYILACRSRPQTDCQISFPALGSAPMQIRRAAGAVTRIESATATIKRVWIKLDAGSAFTFLPGQFGSISFGELPARDYSFASQPADDELELHVKLEPDGTVSSFVHETLGVGDRVDIKGPFGHAFLRERDDRPIVAVAGGSGLAPIKTIVERAVELAPARRIDVYLSARSEAELYLVDHFEQLATRHGNMKIVTVASGTAHPATEGHPRGRTAAALARDFERLAGRQIYVAGPPAMVEQCVDTAMRLGAREQDCHADAFHTRHDAQAGALREPSKGMR